MNKNILTIAGLIIVAILIIVGLYSNQPTTNNSTPPPTVNDTTAEIENDLDKIPADNTLDPSINGLEQNINSF